MSVLDVELFSCRRVLVPKYPRRKEGVEDGLDERSPEDAGAFVVVDIEGESECLLVVVQQWLYGPEVLGHCRFGIACLSGKNLGEISGRGEPSEIGYGPRDQRHQLLDGIRIGLGSNPGSGHCR